MRTCSGKQFSKLEIHKLIMIVHHLFAFNPFNFNSYINQKKQSYLF